MEAEAISQQFLKDIKCCALDQIIERTIRYRYDHDRALVTDSAYQRILDWFGRIENYARIVVDGEVFEFPRSTGQNVHDLRIKSDRTYELIASWTRYHEGTAARMNNRLGNLGVMMDRSVKLQRGNHDPIVDEHQVLDRRLTKQRVVAKFLMRYQRPGQHEPLAETITHNFDHVPSEFDAQ